MSSTDGDDEGGPTILTATYKSDFPGDYLVHVEEVLVSEHEDVAKDIEDTFWRPGTWLSSNVASPAHGVLRNGWVFQPKTCVYDTFSYEDLMRLSALKEPTWLLILGGSVQRGVFLSLVDMVMAQGQKDNFRKNVVAKCWGYADLQIGNLRLTYQETRWYERNPTMTALKDVGISRGDRLPSEDGGLGKFEHYQSLDPRVKFLSAFPMNQAKLFENQNTRPGKRHYGSSVHYHYVPEDISSPETHNGARMVQSTMTEMLANILIGEAVGTKEALYEKVAAA
ncbi:unnamed protein product, partial [Scytosiphon promiscuus]